MRLTRRGASVLVAAVLLYALGEIAGFVLPKALAGAAAGALLAGIAVTLRRPRVSVRREISSNRIQRGGATTATLVVSNPGARRQPGFTARESSGHGEVVEVHSLAPGASQPYDYKLI